MARVLPRQRLYRLLDTSRRRRVVWIVAPPGAGKTALVASWLRNRKLRHLWIQLDEGDGDVATFFHYLALAAEEHRRGTNGLPAFTPEYLAAPGGFARSFIRALCSGSRHPALIVFDDYHEVRPDSPVHAALRDGLSELPEGATAVVMSRSAPPPVLARLQAEGDLVVLGSDLLALGPREARAIAELWGYSRRDRDIVLALHARTEGWAAGLVLLLAGWRPDAGKQEQGIREQTLFDYFAEEVLARADAATRAVLLETAFLPRISGTMAVRLTGIARAGEILADLSRRGHFVARHGAIAPSYQLHALFREFLLSRAAKALSPGRREELRLSAAKLLEESGEMEGAFQCYVQARAWGEASRIPRACALSLLREGRSETVARWVLSLPQELRDRDPWLLLWLGTARSPLDPGGARVHLERAFDLFRAAGDGTGVHLAWAAVAETYILEIEDLEPLDRWIAILDEIRDRFPECPDPEVEARLVATAFTVLSHRQPWHPATRDWEERALAIALSPGDPHLRMRIGRALTLSFGGLLMDLAKAHLVSDAVRPLAAVKHADPATAILFHMGDANHHLHLGRTDAALEAAEQGLIISAESGLRSWDCFLLQTRCFAAMARGDLLAAERGLKEIAAASDRASPLPYHHMACLVARRRGEVALAREHGRITLALASATKAPIIELMYSLAGVLTAPSESQVTELEGLLLRARRCGMRLVQAGASLALALAAMRRGDAEGEVAHLREGFAAARDLGCLHFVWFEPAELADCCALALKHGIEPGYVADLIRAQKLAPGERARELEAWPWELRIEALGGFAVSKGGEPLRPGRKAQKKPLEMLRLLVAQGERGMRQDLLAEALWPDADGDAASRALGTTVYRLRKLLGKGEAVLHQEGRVALDPRLVFVDAWALERLLDRAHAAGQSNGAGKAGPDDLRHRIRVMYRGELFGQDGDEPSVAEARDRLRTRVARLLRAS